MVKRRLAVPLVHVLAGIVLTACTSQGPSRLQPDRFDYNQAIAQSANEQMLLNLVRLRYSEIPVFLAVTSVLTQYSYASTAGVIGSGGASLGDPLWQVGGQANFVYIERPTITYAPLTGDEFAAQLLKPIPIAMVFSLVDSGWPPDQLLLMALYRLNDHRNMAFEASPEGLERFDSFRSIVNLMIELAKRGAIEVQPDNEDADGRYIVLDDKAGAESQQLVDELKRTLGLDPDLSKFRITQQSMGRQPNEMTLRVRSILELMGFLSQGVDIPAAHHEQHFVAMTNAEADEVRRRIPLHVLSQPERPDDSFVAVQFQDHWYYIEQSDHGSKQAFGLLAYLFQMQAPQQPSAGPLLTVPTG